MVSLVSWEINRTDSHTTWCFDFTFRLSSCCADHWQHRKTFHFFSACDNNNYRLKPNQQHSHEHNMGLVLIRSACANNTLLYSSAEEKMIPFMSCLTKLLSPHLQINTKPHTLKSFTLEILHKVRLFVELTQIFLLFIPSPCLVICLYGK